MKLKDFFLGHTALDPVCNRDLPYLKSHPRHSKGVGNASSRPVDIDLGSGKSHLTWYIFVSLPVVNGQINGYKIMVLNGYHSINGVTY